MEVFYAFPGELVPRDDRRRRIVLLSSGRELRKRHVSFRSGLSHGMRERVSYINMYLGLWRPQKTAWDQGR